MRPSSPRYSSPMGIAFAAIRPLHIKTLTFLGDQRIKALISRPCHKERAMITSTESRQAALDRLVDEHFAAEVHQDLDTLLATFADDVEHDLVGSGTVSHGQSQVESFYRSLLQDLTFESIENVRRYHGASFVVDESIVHA